MTMENKFGKVSRLDIRSEYKDGETILKDMYFTAPYKIMTPFKKSNGGITVMPLCASAGIMSGDRQEFVYHIGEGSNLELISQSFEKVHKMEDEGFAHREVKAVVEKGATFFYYPQPLIPFADSAFDSVMDIRLEDESANLFFVDIVTCGRATRGEEFQYRRFSSKVDVRRGEILIYRDNTRFEPGLMDMTGFGMYEDYTHVANMFMTVTDSVRRDELKEKIRAILEGDRDGFGEAIDIGTDESVHFEVIEGGVTELAYGDLAVRIFGKRAQDLQKVADRTKALYEQV